MKRGRRGFSLIIALIILVLMATILTMALSLSTQTVKQTSDIYLKGQAEIYARSVTEYALLAISGHDNRQNCIKSINIDLPPNHEANLTIWYLGKGGGIDSCANTLADDVETPESNFTIIIDTIVSTKSSVGGEPLRIHRRTVQKP